MTSLRVVSLEIIKCDKTSLLNYCMFIQVALTILSTCLCRTIRSELSDVSDNYLSDKSTMSIYCIARKMAETSTTVKTITNRNRVYYSAFPKQTRIDFRGIYFFDPCFITSNFLIHFLAFHCIFEKLIFVGSINSKKVFKNAT